MRIDLPNALCENTYPGRGIIIGKTADGRHAAIAYFIMGRSENSRNRIFEENETNGIRTRAYDDQSLWIRRLSSIRRCMFWKIT